MDESGRGFLLAIAVIAIAGSIIFLEGQKPVQPTPASKQFPLQNAQTPLVGNASAYELKKAKYPLAIELVAPQGYINLPQGKTNTTIGELAGKKVVLVDFWTYSCINCQRTIPYLNAWYEKYRGAGLEIIGVHTPEFEFEKDYVNVQAAVLKYGIRYPVVQDNDYATWTAYRNRYWPHKYLVDIDGFIVYDHIGEGGYE